MNTIQKVLLLILMLVSLLIAQAVLLTAGVISFDEAAKTFIVVALFLMAFYIPFLIPQSEYDE